MKLARLLAIVLILVLSSSPAMAAMCAAKCAGGALMSALHEPDSAAGNTATAHCEHMQDAHDKSTQHQQHAAHKSCSMAGCHFSVAVPLLPPAQFAAVQFDNSALPYFGPFAVSAELPPPIKPPA
ncbi:MAG TPA: hypothetical protein VFX01_00625 [Methylophilaceae bacterium]|nr:hypothetical protein [Methylophilaceae bacterium]